jgi:rare lipoprotein A (peptidoglycan hydrolase)
LRPRLYDSWGLQGTPRSPPLKRIGYTDEDDMVDTTPDRRIVASALALVLVALVPGRSTPAERDRLQDARAQAEAVRAELGALVGDLTSAAEAADTAGRRSMLLRLRMLEVRAAETEARRAFADRVRAAYVGGPGNAVEILLGARTFEDLAARLPYAETILADGRLDVRDLTQRRTDVEDALAAAEEAHRELADAEDRLASVQRAIERRLAEAEAAAVAAGRALEEVQAVRRRYAGTLDRVSGATRTIRRQRGEAMLAEAAPYLGPRSDCSIPKGLRSTGDAIQGQASWYGNEFRGRPTASGAIFRPEQFTVAHKTLPFGLYLLIEHQSRCVVAFLNDRGPYVDGRILDLSHGSAQAVGLTGAKDVRATLLVRAR